MTRSLWKGPVIDYKLLLQLNNNHILKQKYKMEYTKSSRIKEILVSRNLTVIPYFLKQVVAISKGKANKAIFTFQNKHLNLKPGNLVFSKVHCIFQDKKNKKSSQKKIHFFKRPSKNKKNKEILKKVVNNQKRRTTSQPFKNKKIGFEAIIESLLSKNK